MPNREYLLELHSDRTAIKTKERVDYYMKNRFICAEEVAQELSVSKPYAYKLIRQLNEELKAKGFITISGRVNRQYFYERLYGTGNPQGDTTMSYKAGQK